MALGGTRFGVVRTVVLPFAKGGIIGGTMLALGRALGETAAVLIIISPAYDIKPRILEAGTQTTSALIAGNFGNATKSQLSALLTAGFVLFLITLVVNSVAAVVIRRSRSGAGDGDLTWPLLECVRYRSSPTPPRSSSRAASPRPTRRAPSDPTFTSDDWLSLVGSVARVAGPGLRRLRAHARLQRHRSASSCAGT